MRRLFALSALLLPLLICGGKAQGGFACTLPCSYGWLGPFMATVEMPDPCGVGPPVLVNICYCYPDPGGPLSPKEQVDIQNFEIVGGSPCAITEQWMLELKRLLLSQHLINIGTCEGVPDCSDWCAENPQCICPDAQPSWQVFSTTCMVPDYTTIPGSVVWNECGAGVCGSIFEVCCYDEVPSVRWLASDGIGDECDGNPNCFVICSVNKTAPNLGCTLSDGTPVLCCCGGGCPEPHTGKCPEDEPCLDASGNPTGADRCCDGTCPERTCLDINGDPTLFECCDGSCPDPVTGECQ